ncbi:G-protein coupled receptor 42-like [Misgurnus anguillicaudatus]|uniref:G-protein coupled receptor 42-like n=1 Tax=Misgurnus anguillicaudatus TaxID=75329 RepID=UPI003CCF72E6
MFEDARVYLSIYIITFLIGFPDALLAFCCCIRKIRSKPIPIDIFMLNLVISDLIFLIFLPLKMKEAADNMIWKMPYILCPIHLFTFFLPIYSSCLFLAGISAERYVCVAFPVKYRSPRRITFTILISVAMWMLVIGIAAMSYKAVYIDFEAENITDPQSCHSNFINRQLKDLLTMRLIAAVFYFCIPLIICCFCYINAIRILLKLPLIGRHRKLRSIGLALGTLLVFAICFAPYNVSHIVGYIMYEDPKWRLKVLMLTTLNTCFDLIIFYCISWEMRRAFVVCVESFYHFYDCLNQFCCCFNESAQSNNAQM